MTLAKTAAGVATGPLKLFPVVSSTGICNSVHGADHGHLFPLLRLKLGISNGLQHLAQFFSAVLDKALLTQLR